MTKSVAKVLSPLILSFLTLLGVFWFVKANFSGTLWTLSMFMSDGETAPQPQVENIFEEYKKPAEAVDTVDANDIVFPKRGALYARLSIDSCGIEDDVYFSDDEASLRNGLGQYYGSGIPGFGKPILIAGHNNRAFHTLGDAKLGDIVTITTSYGIYEYEITDTVIRDSKDFSRDELDLDEERLILYTCYPFTTMSLTSQRYFVYAQKISGPVVLH